MNFLDKLQHGWNAFLNKDPPKIQYGGYYGGTRPDRPRYTRGNERSIVSAIYTRISIDAAATLFEHVQLDDDGRFLFARKSGLNECLTVSANIDQTGRSFMQDVIQSMLDEGCIAIVPVDTTDDNMRYDDFTPEKADFETEDDFARFMDFVKSVNLHESDVTVTGDDHLLTLITCDRTYCGADGRFVVMAVRKN